MQLVGLAHATHCDVDLVTLEVLQQPPHCSHPYLPTRQMTPTSGDWRAASDLSGVRTTSATGTRTRAARVRAEYPGQLDYSGFWYPLATHGSSRLLLVFL